MNENDFKFPPSVVLLPMVSLLILWLVFWADVRFSLHLAEFGIFPHTTLGLRGILFSPFIHGGIEHLYNNSVALAVLLAAMRFFYRDQTFAVIVLGVLVSGIVTWSIGRPNYHIGASGLVYALVSFMFFKGIFTTYYRLVALSLSVIMIYGGMIWYVFPHVDETISWEGHLGGFMAGLVLAFFLKTPEFKKAPKFEWEKPDYNPGEDKFLQRFDESGNFVNLPKPEPILELQDEIAPPTVKYFYIPNPLPEVNPENDGETRI